MDIKKSVDVLNALISINNKRLKKYEAASLQTDEPDLIDLFSSFQKKSKKNKTKLISEIQQLDEDPIQETAVTFPFLKIWLKIKSKFRVKDREDLLNCCEYDEDIVIKKYQNILRNNLDFLTVKQQKLVKTQLKSIKTDHDILKNLGDMLITYQKFNLDT